MSSKFPTPNRGRRSLALAAFLLVLPACGRSKPDPNAGVAVRLGDLTISNDEVERHVEFYRKWDPALAPGRIRRTVMLDEILPRAVIAALVPEDKRREIRAKIDDLAKAVAQAGGSLDALRRLGEPLGGREDSRLVLPLNDLSPDVAEVVFSLPVGVASGAIHSTYGSLVVAVVEEVRTKIDARMARRIYSVFIPYSTERGIKDKVRAGVQVLCNRTAYIRRKYMDDLAPLFKNRRLLEQR